MFRRAAAILLASLATAPLHAQQISLTPTRNLDFGRFVAGAGGTVAVDVSGARSKSGAVILLYSPNAGQAQFSLSGKGGNGKGVSISLPADGSTLLTSGSATMAVNAFIASPSSLNSMPAGGTTLSVGATLSVAPNQAPGTYSGSFSVIVNYQ